MGKQFDFKKENKHDSKYCTTPLIDDEIDIITHIGVKLGNKEKYAHLETTIWDPE